MLECIVLGLRLLMQFCKLVCSAFRRYISARFSCSFWSIYSWPSTCVQYSSKLLCEIIKEYKFNDSIDSSANNSFLTIWSYLSSRSVHIKFNPEEQSAECCKLTNISLSNTATELTPFDPLKNNFNVVVPYLVQNK